MRKFSELSNNDQTVDSATNKSDFIKNLVEESLTIVDGEITGKDTLVKTLNKIIEINDSKTRIEILESVKINAYRGGFDFNLISNAIEAEKEKLNNPIEEEVENKEGDIFFAQPNDKIVSMSESVDNIEVEETTEEEVIEEAVKGDDDGVEDPADEDTVEEIKDEIMDSLMYYDDRANIDDIQIEFTTNKKGFNVSIFVSYENEKKEMSLWIGEDIFNDFLRTS